MKPRSKEGEERRLAALREYYKRNPHFSEERIERMREITKRQWIGRIRPIKERFWEKVNIGANGDCWIWKNPFKSSYPLFSYNRFPWPANRMAYFLHNGNIPDGAHICHTCDNKACCNPYHLYAGTPKTNVMDAISRKRFKFPPKRNGSLVYGAKLSEESVRKIRSEFYSVPYRKRSEYAKKFGVSLKVLREAVTGKNWKHVK